jgi:hypothetical protein
MAWLIGFVERRVVISIGVTAAAFVVFWVADVGYDVALREVQFFNGWVLTACIGALVLFKIRKRVVILPFGRVRQWLLLHYYVGFLCLGVFLVHTHFRLPDSPLEWILWTLFVLVGVSGLVGGLLSKLVPLRLEAHGERVIFERISVFRVQLAKEAEAIALESIKDADTVSIARFYADTLVHYFARPRYILAHLLASNVPRARLLGEIDSIDRYLDKTGKAQLARLRDLVIAKDNLDFHYVNAGLLKVWLFLHIPATYAMLVVIVIHIVLSYAFSSGVA